MYNYNVHTCIACNAVQLISKFVKSQIEPNRLDQYYFDICIFRLGLRIVNIRSFFYGVKVRENNVHKARKNESTQFKLGEET